MPSILKLMQPGAATEVAGESDVAVLVETGEPGSSGTDFRVILYNDEWHGVDEVVVQVMKACECQWEEALRITEEAHFKGRAVCFRGPRPKCQKVAAVLREIKLQCEVDCD